MSAETARASAWNLKPLDMQVIITSASTSADALIDVGGDKVALDNFSKQESRIYSEFGLFKNLMFVGQAGYQTIDFKGAGSDVDFIGFDETKLGLQYQLWRKPGLAASIQASYVIDGGLDDPRLNLGGRNDEVEIRALYGRSRHISAEAPQKWIWFYDIQAATRYDLKTEIISRWQVDLTAGVKPSEKWMGLAQIYASQTREQIINQFTTPEVTQLKGELSIAYKIRPKRYIQLGATQTLGGRNIVQETGYFVSLWQEF